MCPVAMGPQDMGENEGSSLSSGYVLRGCLHPSLYPARVGGRPQSSSTFFCPFPTSAIADKWTTAVLQTLEGFLFLEFCFSLLCTGRINNVGT